MKAVAASLVVVVVAAASTGPSAVTTTIAFAFSTPAKPATPPFLPRTSSSSSSSPCAPSSALSLATSPGSEDSHTPYEHALIFDCDGVIIETEELHRLAYNAAFHAFHLRHPQTNEPIEWSVEYYDILQNTVGGGKPKMFHHFRNTLNGVFPTYKELDGGDGTEVMGPPETEEEQQALIDSLQAHKTELYKKLIAERATPRPGVIELMDEALSDPTIAVGVCSASTKAAVTKVLDVVLGEERRRKLDVCILGDDVTKLKPDPLIYVTAAERLGMDVKRCVVVEDSMVGLRAAKGAGMKCLITYTSSTKNEDFYGEGADAKVPELGCRGVTLDTIFGPIRENGLDAEIVVDVRDSVVSSLKS